MGLTHDEIDFNRQTALRVLRTNPAGHKQILRKLTDNEGGYCAVGEIGEALHVSPLVNDDQTVHSRVVEMLGISSTYNIVYKNDMGWANKNIADMLAQEWGMI